jgi:WD40 repeat protein
LSCAHEVRITNLERIDRASLEIPLDSPELRTIAWSPDGRQIACSAGEDGKNVVFIFDSRSGELIHRLTHTNLYGIWSLAWSPDGNQLVTLPFDGEASVWDPKSGERLSQFETPQEGIGGCVLLEPSPDNRIAALSTPRFAFEFRDPETWERKQSLRPRLLKGCPIDCAQWDSTGRYLALLSPYQQAMLDVKERRLVYFFERKPNARFVWSPDDRLLAVASTNGTLVFSRSRDGEVVHVSKGHTGTLRDVDWAPDGRRLATCSNDRTVRIWDAATGTELIRLPCGERPQKLAFSPDGRRIACGIRHGLIRIWGSPDLELPSGGDHLVTGVLNQVPPFEEQPTYQKPHPIDPDLVFE